MEASGRSMSVAAMAADIEVDVNAAAGRESPPGTVHRHDSGARACDSIAP